MNSGDGFQALIQTYGWSPEEKKDVPLGEVHVSLMLLTEGSAGSWKTKICKTPEELWNFLLLLDSHPVETLKREFNYIKGRYKKKDDLAGVNVEGLLKKLQSLNLEENDEND